MLYLAALACAPDLSESRYRFTVQNGTNEAISGDVCFDDGREDACLQVGPYLEQGETDVTIWMPSTPIEGVPSLSAYVLVTGDEGGTYLTPTETFTGAQVDPTSDTILPLLDASFVVTEE